jgi:hypothetical protein
MQARTPGAKRAGAGEHLFDLRSVNRVMGGPDYSPVFGGCVEGERRIVAMQFDGEWLRGGPGLRVLHLQGRFIRPSRHEGLNSSKQQQADVLDQEPARHQPHYDHQEPAVAGEGGALGRQVAALERLRGAVQVEEDDERADRRHE